jgi:hypothetical protein
MSDTPPPAFPGTPDEPTNPPAPEAPSAPPVPPAAPSAPQFPAAPQFSSAPQNPPAPPSAPPVPPSAPSVTRPSDYGTPPPPPGAPSAPNSPYAGAQYPATPYAPGTISPNRGISGLALASVIVGGLALLGAFIPFVNYATGFLAFIGLVLGVIAIFIKGRKRTLAIVGSAVSLVALILSIVLAIAYTGAIISDVNDTVRSNRPTIEPLDPTEAPVGPDDDTSTDQGAPAAGDLGSREKPVPIGSSVDLTYLGEPAWKVTVNAPTFNADAAVEAENPYSDKAPSGTSYALLPITVTNTGTENAYAAYVQVGFEAADGTTYEQYDSIAIAPGAIDAITDLPPGQSASGNIAIAIPAADAEKGFWVIKGIDGTKFYYSAK